MCGIVGTLAFEGSGTEVEAATLARMRDTMIHRGPDGAGLWISEDRRTGLAHRRLTRVKWFLEWLDGEVPGMDPEDDEVRE